MLTAIIILAVISILVSGFNLLVLDEMDKVIRSNNYLLAEIVRRSEDGPH
jgi:hypothetical protein